MLNMVGGMSNQIYIVDDVPENLILLSRILTNRGYPVKTFPSGIEAIRSALQSPPSLILLDINMPIESGIETCARLKITELLCDIPIIFISALDTINDKVSAFEAGGVDYIIKPFDSEEVLARVETHLALQNLRMQLKASNRELAERLAELTYSQELLKERERKLNAFIAALPNLSFVYDEEGRYLEILANEPGLLLTTSEELKGRLLKEIIPPQVADRMMVAIQAAIDTGKTQVIEYKLPILTGEERWFEGRFALMEKNSNGHSKVILVATEISERVQLYQEVQRLADLDPLTGCFNRRHFMVLANRERQRSLRSRYPFSILIFDIDHFKNVNDRQGHQIGDQMLCAVVNSCQKMLRSSDFLGRIGGEEFIVLMPKTTAEGALRAAERLRIAIENTQIDTPDGKTSITVSVGLCSILPDAEQPLTLELAIKKADQALYAAKDAGRNCVRSCLLEEYPTSVREG